MIQVLTAEEFTQSFTERIGKIPLEVTSPAALSLELHYGQGEPVLKLALTEVYERYCADPSTFEDLLSPYIADLSWTIQAPRYGSEAIYNHTLPVLRNFVEEQPAPFEMDCDPSCPKGPIAYTDVLRSPIEYVVAQFHLAMGNDLVALRRGDYLPCSPDLNQIAQLAFANLAVAVDDEGLTAELIPLDRLQVKAFRIGIAGEKLSAHVSALVCVPQIMLSLEGSLGTGDGLIGIMPGRDQLIVSPMRDDTSITELGVLAQQAKAESDHPLSSYVWGFRGGKIESVQLVELQEVDPSE